MDAHHVSREDSMQTVAIFAFQTKELIAHFFLLRAGNVPS
jgi:hypothetical protein